MSEKYSTIDNSNAKSDYLPTVILVGRPNVGKSTFFNRLVGENMAIESTTAGTTRDWQDFILNKRDIKLRLIDSAGIEQALSELDRNVQSGLNNIINQADLVCWIVDGASGINNQDLALKNKIRSLNKTTWLIVNKCDNPKRVEEASDYLRFGFTNTFFLSALHQKNMVDIKDSLFAWAKNYSSHGINEAPTLKFSIIGRPNVGKSSILNKIINKPRSVISSVPGTTRDAISSTVNSHSINWQNSEPLIISFTDTAGIRRKNKNIDDPERQSTDKTLRAIAASDIVIFVLDASEEISKQDLHVAGLAHKQNKSVIIVVNKWDKFMENAKLDEVKERDNFIWKLQNRFKFLRQSPVIFTSVKDNLNITELRSLLEEIWLARNIFLDEANLQKFITESNFRVCGKVNSVKQIEQNPPKFLINKKEPFHTAEIHQLKNAFKEYFEIYTTPINIEFDDDEEL